jgi:uncharacterized protein (DUF58 family)
MKVTRKGEALTLLSLSLLFGALLFRDFLIGVSFFVVLLLISAEAAWVKLALRKPETKVRLTRHATEPGESKGEVLYPGDQSSEKVGLVKNIGGKVEFQSNVNFLSIEPKVLEGPVRDTALEFKFSTPYAGEYSGQAVGIEVTGPLGLFSSKGALRFERNYTVYPRLLQVAAATVKLLGRAEIGETPIETPGVGSEYYEMREYQPGDDFRSVNWKASARRGELIVVEHMREVGSSFLLVLDARAPGFADTDRLASTFLTIANGLASSGVNFGVLVHDGTRVSAVSGTRDPRTSLGLALKAAVRVTRLDSSPEFLELLPLHVSRTLREIEPFAGSEAPMTMILGLRKEQVKATIEGGDPWTSASRYVRDESTRSVVYVSGLFNNLEPLIELAWQARHVRDTDFSVVNPCRPWESAQSEDEGRRLQERYQRLAVALSTSGVSYYRGDPVDVARRLLSA